MTAAQRMDEYKRLYSRPQPEILDVLERLQLPYWGYVIVRCTYASDEKWSVFMDVLQKQTAKSLAASCQTETQTQTQAQPQTSSVQDALETRLVWTVVEDRNQLDNACVQEASLMFRRWLEGEGRAEIGMTDPLPAWRKAEGGSFPSAYFFPRYVYYIYANAESVESVVGTQLSSDSRRGYVHLIDYRSNLRPDTDDGTGHLDVEDYSDIDRWPVEADDDSWERVRAELLLRSFRKHLEDDT